MGSPQSDISQYFEHGPFVDAQTLLNAGDEARAFDPDGAPSPAPSPAPSLTPTPAPATAPASALAPVPSLAPGTSGSGNTSGDASGPRNYEATDVSGVGGGTMHGCAAADSRRDGALLSGALAQVPPHLKRNLLLAYQEEQKQLEAYQAAQLPHDARQTHQRAGPVGAQSQAHDLPGAGDHVAAYFTGDQAFEAPVSGVEAQARAQVRPHLRAQSQASQASLTKVGHTPFLRRDRA